MPKTRRALAATAAVLWLLACGWSLARGSRELASGFRAQRRVPFTRTSSTDALLTESAPAVTSAAVRRAIAEVPTDGAVLYVGVDGSSSYFPRLYAFSLLALPREMPAVACAPGGGSRGGVVVPFDVEPRILGVIFDGVGPDTSTARAIAPGIWWQRLVTPVAATSQWNLVCPSSPPPFF